MDKNKLNWGIRWHVKGKPENNGEGPAVFSKAEVEQMIKVYKQRYPDLVCKAYQEGS